MGCSEEVSTDAPCLQTRSVSYPLVGPLYRFASAAVCAVVCSRRKSIPRRLPIPPQSSPPTPSRIQSPPPDGDPPQQHHFNLAQQLRPALSQITSWLEDDDVQIIGGLPISAGGFTDLWKGSVDSRLVAIKSYRRYLSFDLALVFLRFSQEALTCSRLSHRNIVSFIGVYSTAQHPFSLVFNFAGHLDFGRYLKTHPTARRLELLAGIARGLNHMHDLDIVHGSLKIGNILVDLDGTARIAGLGSAHTLGHATVWLEMSVEWPSRGSAPELAYPEELGLPYPRTSKASDIYAFGILAWEVFTGRALFPDSFDVVAACAMWKGAQPPRPNDPEVSDQVWEIMKRCWRRVPSERTSIREVVRVLEAERTVQFRSIT